MKDSRWKIARKGASVFLIGPKRKDAEDRGYQFWKDLKRAISSPRSIVQIIRSFR